MNIIIVDDDKLVSLSLKTILEASGEVNVCAIGNCGEEALSLYPKFKPDILLMDIRMDGMSGLTAGKQILETYPYGITEKEYAIIEQVANGLNNKEIAETLYLSEGTVRNYLSSILEKLELRDRTQLAIFYYR